MVDPLAEDYPDNLRRGAPAVAWALRWNPPRSVWRAGHWLTASTIENGFAVTLLHEPFMQHALAAGLLASLGCGVIGTYVVAKRIGFVAGGIAHSALGGMGIAYFFR